MIKKIIVVMLGFVFIVSSSFTFTVKEKLAVFHIVKPKVYTYKNEAKKKKTKIVKIKKNTKNNKSQKKKTKIVKTKKNTKNNKIQNKKKTISYLSSDFKKLGVIYFAGFKWTYYSQRVLPGYGLVIKGRHVDKSGYVCDKYNRICLASSVIKKGKVIQTPLGKKGKIYDCGCPTDTIDVYVDW